MLLLRSTPYKKVTETSIKIISNENELELLSLFVYFFHRFYTNRYLPYNGKFSYDANFCMYPLYAKNFVTLKIMHES